MWLRQPDSTSVQARLEIDRLPSVTASVRLSAETDWTGALVLTAPEPAPGRPFLVSIGGRRLRGRFAPLPGTHTALTFAIGSCHHPFEQADGRVVRGDTAAIYPAIERDLRRADASFLLLLGDQIYSDEPDGPSVRQGLPAGADVPSLFEAALGAYRRVTRGYLGERGFRSLRESLPTYCIWDDHDIFNNWGSRLEKTPLNRLLFNAASRVYREYQHPRNPAGSLEASHQHYSFRYGDVGFLVLDVRGERDYEHGRLLGAEQQAWVRDTLRSAQLAGVQTLFVATSVPVAHASRWMAKVFDRLPGTNADAVRDRWVSSRFIAGRDALLESLFDWEADVPHRQVFLLSGDVHCAAAFSIRRRHGPGVIRQLTSSAFTTPLSRFQRTMNVVATRAPNLFEPRYRFHRHRLIFRNNYGLIRVVPLPEGGHRATFDVRAWDPRGRALRTAARLVSTPSEHRRAR